ncbi:cytochrome P450 6k1-like [Zophobas morio]|uniref:cytochrome P450 6k1-like n=1 Tax=Zophobas morio TaxID=2755281 RepID=UPI0030837166
MILVYLGCFLLILYYLYTRNYDYWESRGVPFEKPFFLFGNFYKIFSGKQHISLRIREIYNNFSSPYVGIYIFNQPNLIIRSPDVLKRILVKDFDKFVNRKVASNEAVDPIAAHTLFTSQDQVWKNLRAKISPVFTSGKMKLMLPLMKACASDFVNHLDKHNGEVIEVRETTKRYAVDIISSCAFGINSECFNDENSEILKEATKLLDFTSFVRSFSIFSFFFVPKFVDIFRLTLVDKSASDYLVNVFRTTFKERQKRNIVRNDLIDLLNNLKQNETFNDSYKFDDVKMASQAISFFTAGNDTTSVTVAFILYELALQPNIQDRLRREIREAFEKYGDFTYEAINEMKYLDMVFSETLRKYPLATFLNRKSATKYTFEETGFTVDEGVAILVPVAALHYDPKYFPNPENFDPERFSNENKHKIVPYTYLPFGDGPRNCIGQRFGTLVGKVALSYCLKDFAFEKAEATSVPLEFEPRTLFMVNKKGLYLRAVKL